MGLLFKIPENSVETQPKTTNKVKLKKGQTINTLIENARALVEEKLGEYKALSKCILNPDELQRFFDKTQDEDIIAIDTETTG